MRINRLNIIILLMLSFACAKNKQPVISEQEIKETEEALIGANRLLIQKDHEKILAYMNENKLNLQESASGLWYGITRQGKGVHVIKNQMVTLKYRVSLLNGTPCYDSDSVGLKRFVAGRGGVESGLEEGILLMNEGAKAIFIMPPHLAYGLPGDGNKIPARSIIIYEVELLKIES
jgi:FKBP-type peptidyl-prolyl cis-trans isomerase FkpA